MCPQLIKQRGRDFLLQQCPVVHVELRGLSHSQAVLQFIKEASSLQDGPVTFYRMRQVGRIQTNQNLKNTWDCNEAESITTSVTWAHDPKLCFLFSVILNVQEKKDMRSSVLLGVTLKGVHIYQVSPTHSIYTFIFEEFDLSVSTNFCITGVNCIFWRRWRGNSVDCMISPGLILTASLSRLVHTWVHI